MFQRIFIPVVIFAIAALLFASGCAPVMPPEPAWEKDARSVIEHAETLFAKKQFEQASKTIDNFFASYPKSRTADRALSLAGEIQIARRNYQQALKYYKELIEKHPSSSLIAEAKYKIGFCYFELKDYNLAIDNLEDREKITDPMKLQRISEMLAAAYSAKGNNIAAIRELAFLAENASNEQQRPGYRDRVREIIEKKLSLDELRTVSSGRVFPADLALLRFAGLLIEQRQYTEAIEAAKEFLNRFPTHPERTRAEMLSAAAATKLSAPRYSVGVLVPQTGPASIFGDRVLKGIQLAVLSYNTQNPDNRIELIIKDTEGSPDKAASAFTELSTKGVAAVIGPLLTREAEAVAPLLAKAQIPVITPTASGAGLTELSPWIFRNALTNTAQAAAAAQYGLKQKLRKFVIFAPDDPYGRDLSRIFTRELAKKADVLTTITYPPETNDFGPYIRRLIEIDLRSMRVPIPDDEQERKKLFQAYSPSFDGLYIPGYAEKVGLLLPQLAFYNITGKVVIGSSNWHSKDLVERASVYAEGAVFIDGFFPESIDPKIKSVIDAYRSAYQEEPDILAAQAYDAGAMIAELLKAKKDTPAMIQEGLRSMHDFPGISGLTSFNGNGEAQKKLFFIIIENGKFTLLPE